ncbi:MAG: hypothetical protein DLM71_07145 [Chloroflexi bacterium]|nr:MAG: hypothetical protein DLM71_07145 [Chloroflexota bacterium]
MARRPPPCWGGRRVAASGAGPSGCGADTPRCAAARARRGPRSSECRGRVVTRGRLLRAVWGVAYDDESHYLHVHVANIGRKIAAVDTEGRLAELVLAEPGGRLSRARGGRRSLIAAGRWWR